MRDLFRVGGPGMVERLVREKRIVRRGGAETGAHFCLRQGRSRSGGRLVVFGIGREDGGVGGGGEGFLRGRRFEKKKQGEDCAMI